MFILTVAEALGESIISLPQNLYLGTDRTMRDIGLEGHARAREDWNEDIRLYRVLKRTIIFSYKSVPKFYSSSEIVYQYRNPISQAIAIIIGHYLNTLPPCAIAEYAKKAGIAITEKIITKKIEKFGSNISDSASNELKNLLIAYITDKIAAKIILAETHKELIKKIVRWGVGIEVFIIITQSIIESAARASHRLKAKHPIIYYEFEKHDLDMIYFLIEKPMEETYLKAISDAEHHPVTYKKKVIKKICKDSSSD